MKRILLMLTVLSSLTYPSFSQGVGVGTATPDASAILDATHTSKGLLIPRMNMTGINAISNPAKGLLVYDSVANQLMVNKGTPTAKNWQPVASAGTTGWSLTGNSGTNPATNFIGTTNNQPLRFRVNNLRVGELHPATGNVFWGILAGQSNTTGGSNVGIGTEALLSNQTGSGNTAIGFQSLNQNTGSNNTAAGYQSLYRNTIGTSNTAFGYSALAFTTTGHSNVSVGHLSLGSNSTGHENVAIGSNALVSSTTAFGNTAVGYSAMRSNTTGTGNVAIGSQAMYSNIDGIVNVAIGVNALRNNTFGYSNVAVGNGALGNNTGFAGFNVAIGTNALQATPSSNYNVVIGSQAVQATIVGFNNVAVGANTDIAAGGFNTVVIGESAVATASSQVRLGNTSTTSIGGYVGFSNISDGRYKKNIHEEVKGLDFIMKLRPVTYQLDIASLNKKLNVWNGERANEESAKKAVAEKEKMIFSGFIAQEVEEAAKQTNYDFSGVDKPKNETDLYGLRYADFVVPMVKAMQEQQNIINELKKQNAELLKRITALENK